MNHEDDFKTTQGENEPNQVQDPSNLSQNETPQKEPDDQTADFRTLATSPANEPVRNPPNTRPFS